MGSWTGLTVGAPNTTPTTLELTGRTHHFLRRSRKWFRFKIEDSKAFIRQCTDINHKNRRNNVKTNQIFLDEYMSGDPRSRGALRPETGRGEGSVGWIFTPNGVSTGWILTPAGVSIFHKNDPQRVAKYENFINITTLVAQNEKKWYPTGVFFTSIHLYTQPDNQGMYLRWKKGRTSLLTLTEGVPLGPR